MTVRLSTLLLIIALILPVKIDCNPSVADATRRRSTIRGATASSAYPETSFQSTPSSSTGRSDDDEPPNPVAVNLNINISMDIGERHLSIHDSQASISSHEALKAVASLLSLDEKNVLENDIKSGLSLMHQVIGDLSATESNDGHDGISFSTENTEEMSESSDEQNNASFSLNSIVVAEKNEKVVKRRMNTLNSTEPSSERFQLTPFESVVPVDGFVDNGRFMLECSSNLSVAQIRIKVASDVDGLNWTVYNNSTDIIVLEGGASYTYDGDEVWYKYDTCINASDCYVFSISEGEQNGTYSTYDSYEIIIKDDIYDSDVGRPGTTVRFGKCSDNDGYGDDDDTLSETDGDNVDDYQPGKCDLKPLLAPINHMNPTSYSTRTLKIMSIISAISGLDAFVDPASPQYQAACWILYDDEHRIKPTDISLVQRFVLAVMYYSSGGSGWKNQFHFISSKDECDWSTGTKNEWGVAGIVCTDGLVTSVNLGSNNLKGNIASELSKLRGIDSLILARNALVGSIPSELGQILNLTSLVIGSNLIGGTIPFTLYQLPNLAVLDVSNNTLTGTLSTSIGNLTSLTKLKVSSNMLEGNIPEELYYAKRLGLIEAYQNSFTGTISTNIGSLRELRTLDLSQNNLSGSIPFEIGYTSLISVNFDGNLLTGSIPSSISLLASTRRLILSNNKLQGTIPHEIVNITGLTTLDLSHNSLRGKLPVFPEKLQNIRVNNNYLEGTIPSSIATLEKLFKLRLEANNLTGDVPKAICDHFRKDPGSHFGYQTIFSTDCAHQFLPPKVNCDCCTWCTGAFSSNKRSGTCPGGEIKVDINYKQSDWYRMSWYIHDSGNQTIFQEGPLLSLPKVSSYKACVSLSDCYEFKSYNPTGYEYLERKIYVNGILLDASDNASLAFGYDSSTDSLTKGKCDQVEAFGKTLSKDSRVIFNEMAKASGLSTIRDTTSPQYKAAQWTINDAERKSEHRSYLQRYILALLYFSTAGERNWTERSGYLSSEHECAWFGVTCDIKHMNVVRAINLTSNNLGGSLLSELGELSALEYLDVSYNANVTGQIPVEFANMWSLLELNLEQNRLNGTLSEQFDSLEKIEVINLRNNILSGSLPSLRNLFNLQVLDLSHNYLGGEIPTGILPTESLVRLDLGANLFQGPFPYSVVHASNLQELILSHNEFTSSIPPNIGNLQHLTHLSLDQNRIRGTIPTSVHNLTKLVDLMLYNNDLTGTIPSEIGLVTPLERFAIGYNSLKGTVPPEIRNLRNLALFHMQGNVLSGSMDWMGTCDFWSEDRSFISDCGFPSDLENRLECHCCTQCCNAYERCQNNDLSMFTPLEMSLFGMVGVCLAMFIVVTIIIYFVSKRGMHMKYVELDCVETSGEDSVYCLVLTSSAISWIITILTVILQIFLFILFLLAASFKGDDSDWVYTQRCPASSLDCTDEREISNYAWVIFVIFMIISLLPDLLNGMKLVYKAASAGSFRCLVSGIFLIFVSVLAGLTSYFYNHAIAMSNTEVIINAAVLLFINDVDERVHLLIYTICPDWLESQIEEAKEYSERLQRKVSRMTRGSVKVKSSLGFKQMKLHGNDPVTKTLIERVEELEEICKTLTKNEEAKQHDNFSKNEDLTVSDGELMEDLTPEWLINTDLPTKRRRSDDGFGLIRHQNSEESPNRKRTYSY